MVVQAGDRIGCSAIEELVIEAPVLLDVVRIIRVAVGGADDVGGRTVAVHSRQADGEDWIRHATGRLASAPPPRPASAGQAWPPPGAERIDVAGLYDTLESRGYEYGPTFRGLTAAWRRDEDLLGEVELQASPAGSSSIPGCSTPRCISVSSARTSFDCHSPGTISSSTRGVPRGRG